MSNNKLKTIVQCQKKTCQKLVDGTSCVTAVTGELSTNVATHSQNVLPVAGHLQRSRQQNRESKSPQHIGTRTGPFFELSRQQRPISSSAPPTTFSPKRLLHVSISAPLPRQPHPQIQSPSPPHQNPFDFYLNLHFCLPLHFDSLSPKPTT